MTLIWYFPKVASEPSQGPPVLRGEGVDPLRMCQNMAILGEKFAVGGTSAARHSSWPGMIGEHSWLYRLSGPGGLCPRVHITPPPRMIVWLKLRCAFRREATSTLGPDPHPGKR